MTIAVRLIYKRVVIDEILVSGIVWRINVDEIDFTAMRILQQFQRGKVVALNEKVHFAAIVDKTFLVFRKDRNILFKFNIDALFVFLENKSVLP